MKCPNCNAEIKPDIKFCEFCGKEIINNKNTELKKDNISTEEYYKNYIGENYHNFKNKFNIFAFIFGGLYIFYRKQYLLGTIFILISILTMIVTPVIAIILHILLGITYNQQYLKYVDKKTSDIKIKNINKSKEEILKICCEKGQTSIISSVISIIIIIILIILILKIGGTNIKDNKGKPIIKTSDNEIKSLVFNIPDEFKPSNYNNESYKTFTYNENKEYCRIIIQTSNNKNYQSIDEYISNTIYKTNTDQVSTTEDKTINTKTWKKMEVKNSKKTTTYYSIKYNELYYTVSYVTYENKTVCNSRYNSFINSLNFK